MGALVARRSCGSAWIIAKTFEPIEIIATRREGMLKWAVLANAVAAETIIHKQFQAKNDCRFTKPRYYIVVKNTGVNLT